jgi:hypothetical protein
VAISKTEPTANISTAALLTRYLGGISLPGLFLPVPAPLGPSGPSAPNRHTLWRRCSCVGLCCCSQLLFSSLSHLGPDQTSGQGSFAGNNELDFTCGDSFFGGFTLPFDFDLAYTKSKWNNTYTTLPFGAVRCFVSSWCTAGTTPPTFDPGYIDQHPLIAGQQASCWQYYDTDWIAFKWTSSSSWICIPLILGQNAIGPDDSSVKSCTKL